jgi:uncharacterized cupin superfamily protein
MTAGTQTLPPDDPTRGLTVARPVTDDAALTHVAIAGDTYTILLSGDDTAGRFTLIDMLVPPGGGPLPHFFRNTADWAARLLCTCAPSGLEEFFLAVGDLVNARTSPAPDLDDATLAARMAKAVELAPRYRMELLLER